MHELVIYLRLEYLFVLTQFKLLLKVTISKTRKVFDIIVQLSVKIQVQYLFLFIKKHNPTKRVDLTAVK